MENLYISIYPNRTVIVTNIASVKYIINNKPPASYFQNIWMGNYTLIWSGLTFMRLLATLLYL